MRTAAAATIAMACAACGGELQPTRPTFVSSLPTAHDAAAMRRWLGDTITNGGMWFADVECAREFGEPGSISGGRVDAFAACLAKLELRASPRRDALPDVVVLEYAPGFEVEARVVDQRVSWIGYSARLEGDALPSVSASALEALRVAGDRDGPIADASVTAKAWLHVCIDEAGGVTDVRPREASPNGAEAFVTAARAWRFKPFAIGERALAVCAMFRVKAPPVRAPDEREVLPMPLPMNDGRWIVPEQELHRVAGDKLIVPDDRSQARLVGSFKICLDVDGRPSDVIVLRSTRSPAYDQKVLRTIKDTWRYAPIVIDGKTYAVCTAVTFMYSRR